MNSVQRTFPADKLSKVGFTWPVIPLLTDNNMIYWKIFGDLIENVMNKKLFEKRENVEGNSNFVLFWWIRLFWTSSWAVRLYGSIVLFDETIISYFIVCPSLPSITYLHIYYILWLISVSRFLCKNCFIQKGRCTLLRWPAGHCRTDTAWANVLILLLALLILVLWESLKFKWIALIGSSINCQFKFNSNWIFRENSCRFFDISCRSWMTGRAMWMGCCMLTMLVKIKLVRLTYIYIFEPFFQITTTSLLYFN